MVVRISTRSRRQQEIEMALVDWMLREDRKMFEKKEILETYC